MFYCHSTGGFYIPGFNAEIPADAVEISNDTYEFLKSGLSNGKKITVGSDGVLSLTDYVQPAEKLEELERQWRDGVIARTDYLVMPDYPITDSARSEVLDYRQKLRDWPAHEAFPEQRARPRPPDWLDLAVI